MKKLIFIFFTVALVGNFSNATAGKFKTVDEAIQKLSKYEPTDLEGELERFKTGKIMNIDRMYQDLELATKLVKTAPLTEELAFQMERVALITIINNPAAHGVGLILPAYIKDPKIFEAAAEGLSEYDEVLILETLKGQKESLDSQD
jgi:hypothetical protein